MGHLTCTDWCSKQIQKGRLMTVWKRKQQKVCGLTRASQAQPLAGGQGLTCTGADFHWPVYLNDPIDWWGDKKDQNHGKSSYFGHRTTNGVLWIEHWVTPEWVTEALSRKTSSMKAGRGRVGSRTGFEGTGRGESAVYLKSSQGNEYSWTLRISRHAKGGQGWQALKLYEEMQKDGVKPSRRTFVALLKACCSLQELESAKRIHMDVVRSGYGTDLYVGTMLVDVYAKCRSLVDARHAFEEMPCHDVVSWNAIILGYAQMGKGEEALQLYTRMQQEGIAPQDRTYVSALKACSCIAESGDRKQVDKCLETVRAIHEDIVEGQLESSIFIGTMLVDAYAKCGSLEDARLVFEEMPRRDVVSWNAMILGYAQMNRGEVAMELYVQMRQEGVLPNDRTYVSALKACSALAEAGEMDDGDGNRLKERCLETVRAIHKEIVKRKFEFDVFVGTMLVDVYAKCGSLDDAVQVFEKMPKRSVVSWDAMILAYAQVGEGRHALQLYARMQLEGVVPDERTYLGALKACSSLAESGERSGGDAAVESCLAVVRNIHADIGERVLEMDAFIGTMLVDVYAKCGSLEDARQVFEQMPCRTVVSWTAMIFGYAQMDEGEVALDLYTKMQQQGVVPNQRTYVAALNACGSLAGLEKGMEIHAQILKTGLGVKDSFVSDSLIDMYARCGSMVGARQVFEAMPKKNIVAWNALIAGYAHQGESELVFDLFDRMKLEGQQPDGITFLGLLTVCNHLGLVDKGQKYFKALSRDYGIIPTIKHFTCIIDLLGRAGHLGKAMEMVKTMPFQPTTLLWRCILGACRKWGDVELGRQAFERAVRLNMDDAAVHVLMSNIYAAAELWEEAKEMQAMRLKSRAWKEPGRSRWTDESGIAHVFVVGDRGHPEIYAQLGDLVVKMRRGGYLPHL